MLEEEAADLKGVNLIRQTSSMSTITSTLAALYLVSSATMLLDSSHALHDLQDSTFGLISSTSFVNALETTRLQSLPAMLLAGIP